MRDSLREHLHRSRFNYSWRKIWNSRPPCASTPFPSHSLLPCLLIFIFIFILILLHRPLNGHCKFRFLVVITLILPPADMPSCIRCTCIRCFVLLRTRLHCSCKFRSFGGLDRGANRLRNSAAVCPPHHAYPLGPSEKHRRREGTHTVSQHQPSPCITIHLDKHYLLRVCRHLDQGRRQPSAWSTPGRTKCHHNHS